MEKEMKINITVCNTKDIAEKGIVGRIPQRLDRNVVYMTFE